MSVARFIKNQPNKRISNLRGKKNLNLLHDDVGQDFKNFYIFDILFDWILVI